MTLPLTRLATITTSRRFGFDTEDFMLLCGHRHPTLGIYLGLQDKVFADLLMWVESRAHDPHTDKDYEGYWGFEPLPAQGVAKDLSIVQAISYEGIEEIAMVPAEIPLSSTFEVYYPGEFPGGLHWSFLLKKVSDGVTVESGSVLGGGTDGEKMEFELPPLVDGQSYILWIHQFGGGLSYQWPSDYNELTNSTPPEYFKWIHEDGTEYMYDPIWNIGAKPYDYADESQAYLLELREAAIADGMTGKNPGWVGYLISFNEDGTQIGLDGTRSCLLIHCGVGSFPDFDTVNEDCCVRTLAKISGDSIVGVMRDPRLTAVGAFYTDPDDLSLWVRWNSFSLIPKKFIFIPG